MKPTLFFVLIPLLITTSVNAQASKKYQKLRKNYHYREGYIITKDSTKITGLIKYSIYFEAKKYGLVNFVHTDGKKRKYYPKDLNGYGHSIHKFVSDNSRFYEIVQTGKNIGLYKNISVTSWSTPGPNGTGPMTYSSSDESLYVKRSMDNSFKLVRKKKFKEEFSRYFEDCPALSSEIQHGRLTHEDISRIVIQYNHCK
ncbi:hypothetical protein FNH22_28610 [Fulvivirga sp. M361]|uniref:hypothetical protein n=1 Tax=Fulvivirga sp. M361 TaxID=2594266 RepID=UPI00117A1453|nr:hypothetical protein [Fulvivirga sp. M361]TRX48726.1 hypothetical protein FNH22_28610 [Fulvivirga sp. M361]